MRTIYVIQHTITKQIYIGKSDNIKRRLYEHNSGKQKATHRKDGSWILIYAEVYRSAKDADEREKLLKQHGSNKHWLKNRIKHSMLQD